MDKKAEMGIGTLIIFIAMILVAAIAAGVLLQTAGSLQNKALLTGERSKTQVSTGVSTLLLYGEDGTDQNVETLCQKMKLVAGSDAIKFQDALIEIQTKNSSVSLVYGKELGNISKGKANMISTTLDFDSDGRLDNVSLISNCDINHVATTNECLNFSLSTAGLANVSIGSNLATAKTTPVNIALFPTEINVSGTQYGVVSVIGEQSDSNAKIDDSVYVHVGVSSGGADGAYGVTYLIQGSLYREGYLNRGDMVKICYPAPRHLGEDENLRINFVPKTGAVHVVETALPDVMTHKRVYIFP